MVESLLSKQVVASSSLVYRSMHMVVCNFSQRKKKRIADR